MELIITSDVSNSIIYYLYFNIFSISSWFQLSKVTISTYIHHFIIYYNFEEVFISHI